MNNGKELPTTSGSGLPPGRPRRAQRPIVYFTPHRPGIRPPRRLRFRVYALHGKSGLRVSTGIGCILPRLSEKSPRRRPDFIDRNRAVPEQPANLRDRSGSNVRTSSDHFVKPRRRTERNPRSAEAGKTTARKRTISAE